MSMSFNSDVSSILQSFKEVVYWPLWNLFVGTLSSPQIYIALAITLLAERLIPADPNQKIFSISFFQDMAWFFYETVSDAFINVIYFGGLTWVYMTYFSFLTIHSAADWPYALRFVVGVLLLDFLYWYQHYLNHKVPWLWEFHAVHHSQKEMNFFTDFRYHTFEYIVRKTILAVPFLILSIHTPTIVAYAIVTKWYTRFYHGNVRLNLGPLRHILVTPQSHRIHHSRLPQHRDLNFGSLFCIWDRIFKTQYSGHNEYPPTGIDDARFPLEKDMRLDNVVLMPLRQMVYPVAKNLKQVKEIIIKNWKR